MRALQTRARRQGKRIGRPKVTDRRGFNGRFDDVCRRLDAGDISRRKAAIELGIGFATLKRLLDGQEQEPDGVTE